MTQYPRVLIVTRLFSGLIKSVTTKNWNPTGIPAIYKLIEGMNRRGITTDVVFLCKTKVESKDITCSETFKYRQERVNNIQFHVVPFRSIKIKSTKLNSMYNAFFQYLYCIRLLVRRHPDVVYCDRSHVVFGAIASVLFRKKVFLRLLGFYPGMKVLFEKLWYKIFLPITYLAYFVPFTSIICTQDDSGGGYYLSKLPNPMVPTKLLLNGVDHKESSREELEELRKKHRLDNNWPIMLYVGKLEKSKGCIEFVETMSNLFSTGCKFYALILGAGPLANDIQILIKGNNLQDVVRFVGPVENTLIYHYYNLADIYVHLYLWASLTNTVLEAACAGNALMLISPSPDEHIGEYAEELIPEDCAIRFDRENIVADLSLKLQLLLQDRKKNLGDETENEHTFTKYIKDMGSEDRL